MVSEGCQDQICFLKNDFRWWKIEDFQGIVIKKKKGAVPYALSTRKIQCWKQPTGHEDLLGTQFYWSPPAS